MGGFWKMSYTDFAPAAPSSGKLGPFVGDVFQDLRPEEGRGFNILRVGFPPIKGALVAKARVKSKDAWEIEFDRVGNTLGGVVPFGPKITFEPGAQIRIWEILYLSEERRILKAYRPGAPEDEKFLFVFQRAEEERFSVPV